MGIKSVSCIVKIVLLTSRVEESVKVTRGKVAYYVTACFSLSAIMHSSSSGCAGDGRAVKDLMPFKFETLPER